MSITDIAYECGFNSIARFNATFFKKINVPRVNIKEDREIVTCYFRADGRITKRGNIIFMGITALLNYDCVTLLCSVDCSANISKDFFQCTLSFDVLVLSFLLVPVNQRRSL